jgi:hypothetical protein
MSLYRPNGPSGTSFGSGRLRLLAKAYAVRSILHQDLYHE